MKIEFTIALNLHIKEVTEKVVEATRLGLRDNIVLIANQAIHGSPVKTGNNRRSLFFGVAGMGHNQASGEGRMPDDTWTGEDTSVLDDTKLESAIYSSSGYGGFLETGTYKMSAQPYIYPAYEANKDKLIPAIKEHLA